jgi:Ca-activated chloride channel homolog
MGAVLDAPQLLRRYDSPFVGNGDGSSQGHGARYRGRIRFPATSDYARSRSRAMHRLFALAIAVSCLAGTLVAQEHLRTVAANISVVPPMSAPGITIRKDVGEVRVTFHAFDRHGLPVLDLAPDSVAIFDNGMPVTSISGFHTASDLPLSVALLVDASDSVSRDLLSEQRAGYAFLRSLIRLSDDRALLVAFSDKIEVMRGMTADTRELSGSLQQLKAQGLTALYDAMVATSERLADGDSSASRRAIIVLSDGEDTDSRHILSDAIAAAVCNDVAVYSITVHNKRASQTGQDTLRRMTDATGGRSYVLHGLEELDAVLQQIERDLRTQYFVTYRPLVSDGRLHVLNVASTIRHISIRARKAYLAPEPH